MCDVRGRVLTAVAFPVCACLAATYLVYKNTTNTSLACGVFFFFTMEMLQVVQYAIIASGLEDNLNCRGFVNKILTLAGFLHICLQPYFCHVINRALTNSERYKVRGPARLVEAQTSLLGLPASMKGHASR